MHANPQRCNATAEALSRASAVFPLLLQAETFLGMDQAALVEERVSKMKKDIGRVQGCVAQGRERKVRTGCGQAQGC
jgi:hypothetical protein